MANNKQQQITFFLVFLAAAMIIFPAGQATADHHHQTIGSKTDDRQIKAHMVNILNEMISKTQEAKAKVAVLGNSKKVRDCDAAYGVSLEYFNKAVDIAKAPGIHKPQDEDIKRNILEALQAFYSCDYSFDKSNRPTQLFSLVKQN